MEKIPTLKNEEILHMFQDKISVELPNPGIQLFHSSISASISHELFDLEFENITIRPEFTLNISRFNVKKRFRLQVVFPVETVGFTFSYHGSSNFHIPFFPQPVSFNENCFTIFRCSPHTGCQEFDPGPFTSVNIHFSEYAFKNLISSYNEDSDNKLSEFFEGEYYLKVSQFKPATKSVLKDLLENQFRGLSRQFYLESRIFELLSSQIEHLISPREEAGPEEAAMEKCRGILESNYAAPPSLIELAKQLNTNTFYLKRDFNNFFGTSPYAYLKKYRLNLARKLLSESAMSVTEVANAVGYESLGSFSNAFYEEFGLRPTAAKTTF